ncbi:MAG TPA: hypothetical protein VK879_08930 [Candidatus Sulfomarinibacteraceae bacterium]|nr:hypothetical protein [Candidatus Sulfomarinibacteraceae bacterium]
MARSSSKSESQWGKWVLVGLAALFVGSILWSIVFETMLPLWRAGDWWSIVYHLVGIPLILAGTVCIVYGGFVFVRDTFSAMSGDAIRANVAIINEKSSKADVSRARRENFLALLRAWRPGATWMVAGFILIALGGFLINL